VNFAPSLVRGDVLAEIAYDLAASGAWVSHARVDPDRRHHARLVLAEDYEAWVLGWAPGQHVGVHDHGDASGALVVVEGELTEDLPRRRRPRRRLGVGATSIVPTGELHDVGNASRAAAFSVHVYSPPLSSMTFYDELGRAVVGTVRV
jgi:predicted metal-dependent enzyme (double-stranded beta helix superfamily)